MKLIMKRSKTYSPEIYFLVQISMKLLTVFHGLFVNFESTGDYDWDVLQL